MLVVHDWLKEYIGEKISSAKEIEDLLMFHSFEIEGNEKVGEHEVIDVDILPNRSSDCLCHRGIAREIATLTGESLEHDPFTGDTTLSPITEKVTVTLEDPKGCRRFGIAVVSGVTVRESPKWLTERLEAVGQRSINNVVDVTNYVMLSLGQPLHAYDGDKFPQVDGVWKFGVRYAHDGEKVVTLSDDEYEPGESVQLIVEGKNDTPVGIAGIKGGKTAEVDSGTTTVILEAANFDPTITRKAAQKIKLQTDASKRFENEVSREVVAYALKEAVRILEEIAEGTCEGYVDEYPTKTENESVSVTLEHINALLGLTLEKETVEGIFTRLGFVFENTGNAWSVTAPFERTDINIAEDVIEEVGRVYGYSHVESVVPESVLLSELNARHYYSEKIRKYLMEKGFSEVITTSFRDSDDVELANALASDKGYLRSSLSENIREALEINIQNMELLGLEDVRIFEIGTVFKKGEGKINENVSLAVGVRTKKNGSSDKDNKIVDEAMRGLSELLGETFPGASHESVDEINLSKVIETLPKPKAYEEHPVGEEKQYTPFSSYPFISRDVALWVDKDVTTEEVENVIWTAVQVDTDRVIGSLPEGDVYVHSPLERVTPIDRYEKNNHISYAFRLVFQSMSETLTDDAVADPMSVITKALESKGWEVR